MFGFSHAPELIVLLIIAFLVFGPEKLPELARGAGRGIREFRRITGELQGSLTTTFQEPLQEIREVQNEMRQSVQDMRQYASTSLLEASAPSQAYTTPAGSFEPEPLPEVGSQSPAWFASNGDPQTPMASAIPPQLPSLRLPRARKPSIVSSFSALTAGAGTSFEENRGSEAKQPAHRGPSDGMAKEQLVE